MHMFRANRRRKTTIHHNLHRIHIQGMVQVGAVGVLEEEEAEGAEGVEGVGLVVAADGDSPLREVPVQMTHL